MSGLEEAEDRPHTSPTAPERWAGCPEESYTLAGCLEGTAVHDGLRETAPDIYTLAGPLDQDGEHPPL